MKKSILLVFAALLLVVGPASADYTPTTIYDIQQDNFAPGDSVGVTDVIVTGVDDVPSGYGFWAQEAAGGPHSAIYIFVGVDAPPGVAIGDVVDVEGMYDNYTTGGEVDGLAELNLASAYGGFGDYTVTGTAGVPDPTVLRAWQTKTANPDEAEKWESVLVQVQNVTALDLDPGFGEWFAEEFGYADNDTTRCDDGMGVAGPVAGTQMESITGILNYSYLDFKLTPRAEYDIVYVGNAPAPNLEWACATSETELLVRFDREVEQSTAENPSNYFLDLGTVSTAAMDPGDNQQVMLTLAGPMTPEILLSLTVLGVQNTDGVPMSPQATQFWGGLSSIPFSQYPDAGGDSSAVTGQVLTVRGVIHSEYDVFGDHIYLQNENLPLPYTAYNGLEVYAPSYLDELEEGDVVVIADFQTEYFNMTSFVQPFLYFEKVSSGNPVAPPEVITIGDMTDVSVYEPYEAQLVRVENVVVVERGGVGNFYEWSVTQDDLNWMKVGDMGDYDYVEGLGDTLNITGSLRYDFGEFKIMPRRDADIEILYQNPVDAGDLPLAAPVLAQNHPNPFNPRTEIKFSLPQPGMVRLDIYDATGRRVKTLVEGSLNAGEHHATWQGDTDADGQASSGLYFYRLRAAGVDETRKMMLLK